MCERDGAPLLTPVPGSKGWSVCAGDVAYAVALLNSLLFIAAVIGHSFGKLNFFSPQFMAEGFCVFNGQQPGLDSHSLCFYIDVATAIALWAFVNRFPGTRGLEKMSATAGGVLGHGIAHLVISYLEANGAAQNKRLPPMFGSWPIHSLLLSMLSTWLLLFTIWRGMIPRPRSHAMMQAVLHTLIYHATIPHAHAFTYIQTAIMCVGFGYKMMFEQKDRYYNLSALIVGLPIGFVAWLESCACEVGYRQLGGHLLYDLVLAISFLSFSVIVISMRPMPAEKKLQ